MDSVISENLAKDATDTSNTKSQPKKSLKPQAEENIVDISSTSGKTTTLVIAKTTGTDVPKVTSPRFLTPKEQDDDSTILKYFALKKQFRCDARTCKISTDQERVIKAHITQHKGSSNQWFKCIYCPTITKNVDRMRYHLEQLHPKDNMRFSRMTNPSTDEVYQSLISPTNPRQGQTSSKPGGTSKPGPLSSKRSDDSGKNSDSENEATKKAPSQRTTSSSGSPAVTRQGSGETIKANYMTKLECYYKDQFFR